MTDVTFLCEEDVMEANTHLVVECNWEFEVRHRVKTWSGLSIQQLGVKQHIQWIQKRYWRKLKTEIPTALWEAMIYNIWQASN